MTRTSSSARSRSPEATTARAFNTLVARHPVWAAVILVVVAVGAWFFLRESGPDAQARGASASASVSASTQSERPASATSSGLTAGPTSAGIDPASGLPYIAESDLPQPARQILAAIHAGGPFEFEQDGSVFGNYEGLLPDEGHGYYHEYTVQMPGDSDRGAHRLVTGGDGEIYWTDDHYASFTVVQEDA